MDLGSLIVDGLLEEAIDECLRGVEDNEESLNYENKVKRDDKRSILNRFSKVMFSGQEVSFQIIKVSEKVEGNSKV